MSNASARAYIVGFLTGSGFGLLVGWVLNSAHWYNGSTSGTPVVVGVMTVLCGAGLVIYSLGRRGGGSVASSTTSDPPPRPHAQPCQHRDSGHHQRGGFGHRFQEGGRAEVGRRGRGYRH